LAWQRALASTWPRSPTSPFSAAAQTTAFASRIQSEPSKVRRRTRPSSSQRHSAATLRSENDRVLMRSARHGAPTSRSATSIRSHGSKKLSMRKWTASPSRGSRPSASVARRRRALRRAAARKECRPAHGASSRLPLRGGPAKGQPAAKAGPAANVSGGGAGNVMGYFFPLPPK
jgi:hypothetical protein